MRHLVILSIAGLVSICGPMLGTTPDAHASGWNPARWLWPGRWTAVIRVGNGTLKIPFDVLIPNDCPSYQEVVFWDPVSGLPKHQLSEWVSIPLANGGEIELNPNYHLSGAKRVEGQAWHCNDGVSEAACGWTPFFAVPDPGRPPILDIGETAVWLITEIPGLGFSAKDPSVIISYPDQFSFCFAGVSYGAYRPKDDHFWASYHFPPSPEHPEGGITNAAEHLKGAWHTWRGLDQEVPLEYGGIKENGWFAGQEIRIRLAKR
jgi:hypothetical protein